MFEHPLQRRNRGKRKKDGVNHTPRLFSLFNTLSVENCEENFHKHENKLVVCEFRNWRLTLVDK